MIKKTRLDMQKHYTSETYIKIPQLKSFSSRKKNITMGSAWFAILKHFVSPRSSK
ncbi:hypothetical protein Hanom_Chr06g00492461 [Helianthus anomalus]